MRILLLLIAAVAAVTSATSVTQSDPCSAGACYPPSGDLLLGRGHHLHASSTCGLTGAEVFCTPYQQWKMKCCPCDSRNPAGRLAHTVQDVLTPTGQDRWWQSKKDVNAVSIQLDLHNMFQLDNLVLSFKGPRPDALVIERTLDNGTTWQPALYLATHCSSSFPGVPTAPPRTLDQTYCRTLPPAGHSPYRDHMVQFSPLHQYSNVNGPKEQKIQEVGAVTGLRVRLTELGAVPRLAGRALSKFYAVREMRVMGSCLCHGHAHRCLPDASANTQVGPQCACQHNTAGVNCERCADLYNDLPWRAAEGHNTHTCKRCECNNHAVRCRFDRARFESTGSGGVCEGCGHNTAGVRCERCAPGYRPNPHSAMDTPTACIRCPCSVEGTVDGGRCEDSTGRCRCKTNVEGPHCDVCKRGFYGLAVSNPLGCSKCSCSPDGSRSAVCDPASGQCPCHAHFQGLTCDLCSHGYWKPSLAPGCERCGCDPAHSLSQSCDQVTGQCGCRPGFGGRTCTECPDNTYGDPRTGCLPCQCDPAGSAPQGCDRTTGACLCRPGVAGARCNACSRGRCDLFPLCEACPSCFNTLDRQIHNLSLSLETLASPTGVPTGGVPTGGDLRLRIKALEARLSLLRDSVSLSSSSPGSVRRISQALSHLNTLRERVEQLDSNLLPDGLALLPGLDLDLEGLRALLESLVRTYDTKEDAIRNATSSSSSSSSSFDTAAFSDVQKAYGESGRAVGVVEAGGRTVTRSETTRDQTTGLLDQVQPHNTNDLDKLQRHLLSRPDLSPAAKQVCGSERATPCTPLQCDGGELCPPAPPCGGGEDGCVGALPLGRRSLADAEEVKDQLERLTRKITHATEKLKETQGTTNQVRRSTEKLANRIKLARDDLEVDLKETRDVIKDLKDFLSDPSSPLQSIREVSDLILSARLPLSLADLRRKLEELKRLAAALPDSGAVLREAGPQLDAARRLLQDARDARDAAVGVKADVDGLLDGFSSAEGSLSGLEGKLHHTMGIIDKLNDTLVKALVQLSPAEGALEQVSELTGRMKPQLTQLKALLLAGDQLSQHASGDGEKAKDEADAAAQDLLTLKEQLAKVKAANANSGRGDGASSPGERLQRLQEMAASLSRDTGVMTDSLAGKADSLQRLQDQVLHKSERLQGLDAKLQGLLAAIRAKAHLMATCS